MMVVTAVAKATSPAVLAAVRRLFRLVWMVLMRARCTIWASFSQKTHTAVELRGVPVSGSMNASGAATAAQAKQYHTQIIGSFKLHLLVGV